VEFAAERLFDGQAQFHQLIQYLVAVGAAFADCDCRHGGALGAAVYQGFISPGLNVCEANVLQNLYVHDE
jgi:hypothetical protein